MSSPVTRLLRRNISAGQIAGYAIANLVGLLIVLTAIQFYRDVTSADDAADSFISSDYLIISKRVTGVQGLFGGDSSGATTFTPAEISDIDSQPWADGTGSFTAADFNVTARIDIAGVSMSTALFLESIPNQFFDISPL
ncbi:MAG: ABC transporter permease, partial [Duncaniella sp.]|nr:ABC transporter permease [Duncaniella sp.]